MRPLLVVTAADVLGQESGQRLVATAVEGIDMESAAGETLVSPEVTVAVT